MPIEKIEAGAPASQSADLAADNLAQLRALFPELVTEGKTGAPAINVDVLKALVGDATATDADEKYGLNWHGKRAARQLALTPSNGTLRPCPEESVHWETTQNLILEGDNLEVLKLLQKSYAGKVKMIYIDPPYNTGSDLIYPDNFRDGIGNYLRLTGQRDDGGMLTSNTEANGRFHTVWLNMMLPRLKVARDLLRNDGLIMISINEKEIHNLRHLCDEVLGSENFIATLVWERGRKNDARRFSVGHEYIVVYSKDLSQVEELLPPWREAKEGVDSIAEEYLRLKALCKDDYDAISGGLVQYYKSLPEDHPGKKYSRARFADARGIWRDNNISWPGGGGPRYDLPHPTTKKPCKVPDDGWRFVEETMLEKIRLGYVEFREDHTKSPFLKSYIYIDNPGGGSDEDEAGEKLQVMGSVFYRHSQPSTDVQKELFGEKVFDNPKDHVILSRLVKYCTGPTDTIVDFFAGSGSTGHAVFEANQRDSGRRRFVLVQLPEKLDPAINEQAAASKLCDSIGKPRSISEITKERIRRAGLKIKPADSQDPDIDIGFRVFKLDESNITAWAPKRNDLAQSLFDHLDHMVTGRSSDDVLYELLLKLGLDLCVPIESKPIAGKTVQSIGSGVLLACLDEQITVADAEPLALGIVAWHREQQVSGEVTCVFRDSAFENDVAKTNLAAILEQHGIAKVRSL